jgi:hypothetical protein
MVHDALVCERKLFLFNLATLIYLAMVLDKAIQSFATVNVYLWLAYNLAIHSDEQILKYINAIRIIISPVLFPTEQVLEAHLTEKCRMMCLVLRRPW